MRIWRRNGQCGSLVFIRQLWAQPLAGFQNAHRAADQTELFDCAGCCPVLLQPNGLVFFCCQCQRRRSAARIPQPAPGFATRREYAGIPRRLADAHRRPAPARRLQSDGVALQTLFAALPAKQRLCARRRYSHHWPQLCAQRLGETLFQTPGLSHPAAYRQRRPPPRIAQKPRQTRRFIPCPSARLWERRCRGYLRVRFGQPSPGRYLCRQTAPRRGRRR